MNFTLEHIPLIMGVISFIGAALTYYGGTVKKRYAAERNFNHLKNSYENLSQNLTALDEMIDTRLDTQLGEIKEIKAMLTVLMTQLGGQTTAGFQQPQQKF